MLLDLSAVFDMIDRQIIMDWWNKWFGLGGNAPKWKVSYLVSSLPSFVQSHWTVVWCSQGFSAGNTLVYYVYYPSQSRISKHPLYADETQDITPSTKPVLETLPKNSQHLLLPHTYLDLDTAISVANAIAVSRMHYCNSPLYGVPGKYIKCCQESIIHAF